jgi:hypothetical protein
VSNGSEQGNSFNSSSRTKTFWLHCLHIRGSFHQLKGSRNFKILARSGEKSAITNLAPMESRGEPILNFVIPFLFSQISIINPNKFSAICDDGYADLAPCQQHQHPCH